VCCCGCMVPGLCVYECVCTCHVWPSAQRHTCMLLSHGMPACCALSNAMACYAHSNAVVPPQIKSVIGIIGTFSAIAFTISRIMSLQ
jgi:hypothetical protein